VLAARESTGKGECGPMYAKLWRPQEGIRLNVYVQGIYPHTEAGTVNLVSRLSFDRDEQHFAMQQVDPAMGLGVNVNK
jgi:hypothetical protein